MNNGIMDAKKAQVQDVVAKLKDSASTVVVEYRGLTVAEVTELRRQLRAEEVEFKVYKNSVVRHAAEEVEAKELLPHLVGPNAVAFGPDAVAPARILADFAKKHKALVFKAGLVDGNFVDVEELTKLSKLPNKEGMIAMFAGCLQSPVRDFACVVKAVADAKEEQ